MDRARKALEALRSDVQGLGAEYRDPELAPRLDIVSVDNGFRVYCWGEEALREELAQTPIAPTLVSLVVDGPDTGANGTRRWNLEPFAQSTAPLPVLQHLRLASTPPDHHNRSIIGGNDYYEEGGVLRTIANKAPNLETLFAPSAPEPGFFSAKLDSLTHLWIDAGFEPHAFIDEMFRGPLPPQLRGFSWGEYNERYLDDWTSKTTPIESMLRLVSSEAFRQIQVFELKNPVYSDEDLQILANAAPALRSFAVVRGDRKYFQLIRK